MKNAAPFAAAIAALAASMTTFGCQGSSSPCGELSGTDVEEWSPSLRGDVEAALPARQEAFEAAPENDEARRAYAEVLFKLGNIWEADDVIAPLGTASSCHAGDLRLAALHETEVDRRTAGHEVPDLVKGPKLFDIESQDHPPMIPNPPSGSSLVELTSSLQAHLSWDKAGPSPSLSVG